MELSEELRSCRRKLADERGDGRRGYSSGTRERVTQYVRARRAGGASGRGTAGELGLPWTTIERWESERGRRGIFLPVEVQGPLVVATPVILHGPRGLRIEGADAVFVAELLRALG